MGSPSPVVKYGIIGVGMMGREHLMNLYHLQSHGVAVVAIADPHVPSQQLALDLAVSYNWSIQVFSGHKELLDGGLCDVVVVSAPNMTHYEILMDIINHPKPHHILVEKPLCTTVSHCKKVIEAARKRPNILVHVGLEYRYMPPVAKLIDIVKGGKLGDVKMVAIREHRFPFLVKVNNWNRFNANSGGLLLRNAATFSI
ncbi:Gfo/Idh/MocA-like oxidoreductase, N-terminal [Dillenia turbinata]|uniref:Gfo/Idh/MocA-like oxidoreductase, N-terminal n=1 Tax=Dillenia turbinata TaxID=194707 RepID=A0AAN8WGK5_9MAGN